MSNSTNTTTEKIALPARIMRFLDGFVPEEVQRGPTEILRRGHKLRAVLRGMVN